MDGKERKAIGEGSPEIGRFPKPEGAHPKSLYFVLALSSFAFFLIIWSILTYGGFVDPLFLPSPGRVFRAGVDLFVELGFTTDILNSVYRVMMGFIIAAIIGVPFGLLMGTFKVAEAFTEPVVGFIRYMPASAFIPLFILWLGIGDIEKIAIIFVGSFFQLVLMVAVVAKNVHKDMLETAYTLGGKTISGDPEGSASGEPSRDCRHPEDHCRMGMDLYHCGGISGLCFRDRLHDHQFTEDAPNGKYHLWDSHDRNVRPHHRLFFQMAL